MRKLVGKLPSWGDPRALLGAAGGTSVFPKQWIEQLHERTTILEEIEHFIESIH